jgi:hypothetical protein
MPRGRKKAIDPSILEAALEGLETRRARLDEQIAAIRGMIGGGQSGSSPSTSLITGIPRKRMLSPEARKRIADAQKRRWAEYRKTHKGEAK